MELVIKIPEEVVKNDDYVNYFGIVSEKLVETIKNGTPLPKGHGRLIDEDSIPYLYPVDDDGNEGDGITVESSIKSLPTIIEADKEQEE